MEEKNDKASYPTIPQGYFSDALEKPPEIGFRFDLLLPRITSPQRTPYPTDEVRTPDSLPRMEATQKPPLSPSDDFDLLAQGSPYLQPTEQIAPAWMKSPPTHPEVTASPYSRYQFLQNASIPPTRPSTFNRAPLLRSYITSYPHTGLPYSLNAFEPKDRCPCKHGSEVKGRFC